jgi:multiple sugar transport system substrate-binding protein
MTAALDTQKATNATVLQQPYYLPQFSAITTTDLLPKWQKVLQGDESAKAFLTDAAKQLTAAQQDYLTRSKK